MLFERNGVVDGGKLFNGRGITVTSQSRATQSSGQPPLSCTTCATQPCVSTLLVRLRFQGVSQVMVLHPAGWDMGKGAKSVSQNPAISGVAPTSPAQPILINKARYPPLPSQRLTARLFAGITKSSTPVLSGRVTAAAFSLITG
ncbi:MAG: hypothetical protein IPN08_05340 [Bacteroidales bacterium]|nr:hypothetical protein [Bacteroidales bacterium]